MRPTCPHNPPSERAEIEKASALMATIAVLRLRSLLPVDPHADMANPTSIHSKKQRRKENRHTGANIKAPFQTACRGLTVSDPTAPAPNPRTGERTTAIIHPRAAISAPSEGAATMNKNGPKHIKATAALADPPVKTRCNFRGSSFWPSHEIIMAANQEVTREWWASQRADLDLVVSQVVLFARPKKCLKGEKTMIDPIVEEVRKAREEYARRFNFDLHAMCEDLRRKQKLPGGPVVSFPPRPVRTLVTGGAVQTTTTRGPSLDPSADTM